MGEDKFTISLSDLDIETTYVSAIRQIQLHWIQIF